jgi:hypothetical protein
MKLKIAAIYCDGLFTKVITHSTSPIAHSTCPTYDYDLGTQSGRDQFAKLVLACGLQRIGNVHELVGHTFDNGVL